ncbi:unnamed protein product [Vitrella brassicaformis CCMP3155]|uniref:RNA helicase n=3 Tax=Vitrella brassicaformis TaxID=1169539 RepID=A0A0G4G9X5_VITBC|nr:unnamed protein product [Vitrella brassicaformis CCMP3155]|eukprot:CEM25330.1 unnamed protein product [Vitrella brassicaformis CCMP3155]
MTIIDDEEDEARKDQEKPTDDALPKKAKRKASKKGKTDEAKAQLKQEEDDDEGLALDAGLGFDDKATLPWEKKNAAKRKKEGDKHHLSTEAAQHDENADKAAAPEKHSSSGRGVGERTSTPASLASGTGWVDLHLSRPLIKALNDMGFTEATPIQRDAIPHALQGRDILGTAETGSGKTAAFLLPTLERLLQSPSVRMRKSAGSSGPVATKVLILLPTRELALQCHEMLQSLAKYTPITSVLVAGGFNQKAQAATLRHQPDMVVATPGRILDLLLNSPSTHMELLEIVILDEADRLLELGFKEECLAVLRHCSRGRQTMLFSATLSEEVSDLAALALTRPIKLRVSQPTAVARTLDQEFVKVPSESHREALLLHLCTKAYTNNVIIFFQTKKAAHRVALIFRLLKIPSAELHGNLAQTQRVESLRRFRAGEVPFLLASELASRGLDIEGVETVINFSPPLDTSRYIHRVGRTARMGAEGRAVTLYVDSEKLQIKRIAKAVSGARSKASATDDGGKLFQRSVPRESLDEWHEKVRSLGPKIAAILEEEKVERTLRLAEMERNKAENLTIYKDEIAARPAKQWYQTSREKQQTKIESKRQLKHITAQQQQQQEADDTPPSKKRKTRQQDEEAGGEEDSDADDNGSDGDEDADKYGDDDAASPRPGKAASRRAAEGEKGGGSKGGGGKKTKAEKKMEIKFKSQSKKQKENQDALRNQKMAARSAKKGLRTPRINKNDPDADHSRSHSWQRGGKDKKSKKKKRGTGPQADKASGAEGGAAASGRGVGVGGEMGGYKGKRKVLGKKAFKSKKKYKRR